MQRKKQTQKNQNQNTNISTDMQTPAIKDTKTYKERGRKTDRQVERKVGQETGKKQKNESEREREREIRGGEKGRDLLLGSRRVPAMRVFQLDVLQQHLVAVRHVAAQVALEKGVLVQQLVPAQVAEANGFEVALSAVVQFCPGSFMELHVFAEVALPFGLEGALVTEKLELDPSLVDPPHAGGLGDVRQHPRFS